MSLAVNVVRLRKQRGITQEQLAGEARISCRYLQDLEAGTEANPSLDILRRLKTALDCSWIALLEAGCYSVSRSAASAIRRRRIPK